MTRAKKQKAYSVRQVLLKISDERERAEKLEAALRDVNAEISGLEGELRRSIERGDTLGSKLRDALVMQFGLGALNAEIQTMYKDLEQALRGKAGQRVLLQYYARVRGKHVFGRGYEHKTMRCFRLGLLEGARLVVGRDGKVGLPVRRFIGGTQYYCPVKPEPVATYYDRRLHEFDIFSSLGDMSPPSLYDTLCSDSKDALLFVGDKRAKQGLAEITMPGLYERGAAFLRQVAKAKKAAKTKASRKGKGKKRKS